MTAVAVVRELEVDGTFDRDHTSNVIDEEFLAANELDTDQVTDHLASVLACTTIELERPFLLPVEDIDTFVAASTIAPATVSAIASPLDLPEETIKRLILRILADSHVAQDWGGERDDIHTALVELDGRRVRASFLLKGRGLKTSLRPKNLGKNGDQLTRLVTQPAELFVVQHVGVVDSGTSSSSNERFRRCATRATPAPWGACGTASTARGCSPPTASSTSAPAR